MPKVDSVDVFPRIRWGCMCSLLNKDANLFESEFRGAEDRPFFFPDLQPSKMSWQSLFFFFLMNVNREFLVN